MKVCVIGSKGNMGRRYVAILRHLGVRGVTAVDQGDEIPDDQSHYIIATPTSSHDGLLDDLLQSVAHPVSILCEKPILKIEGDCDLRWLDTTLSEFYNKGSSVFMVNNYNFFPRAAVDSGETLYDFYNSGGDGIWWDCIQLVHLAKQSIVLRNDSPEWRVKINGGYLDRSFVDHSYVMMLCDFINSEHERLWGKKDILEAHMKAFYYARAH